MQNSGHSARCPVRALAPGTLRRTALILAILLTAPLQARTGFAAEAGHETAGRIAAAIRDLGDPAHAVREAASKTLWALADEAEPAIRLAAISDDPEVAQRAEALLTKLSQGIRPETSEETLALTQRFKTTHGFEKTVLALELISADDAGPRSVLRLIESEPSARVRQQLAMGTSRAVQTHLAHALVTDDPAMAEICLRLAMIGGEDAAYRDYVAFKRQRNELEDTQKLLEGAQDSPAKWRALTWVYRGKEDLTSALVAARKSQRPGWVEALREETGQWEALSADLQKSPRPNDIEWLGYRVSYARLAGLTNRFAQAVRDVEQHAAGNPENAWFAMEALLLNDEVDRAISLLLTAKLYDVAARLLYQRRDFVRLIKIADECIANEANRQDVGLLLDIAERIKTGDHRMRALPPEMLAHDALPQHEKPALRKGDEALQAGNLQDAVTHYHAAVEARPGDVVPLYLEGIARIQLGQADAGQALIDRANTYPLARETERARLAYSLELRHQDEHALRQWQQLWTHAEPDSVYRIDGAPRIAKHKVEQRQLYREAIHDLEFSQLHLLRKNISVTDVSHTISVRNTIARYRTREALGNLDIHRARACIQRAKRIQPLDIELAIDVYHALKNGQHAAMGEAQFDETFHALNALCKQYPLLAEIHNEAAWLAARCRRELDEAEALAQRAVTLTRESPEYLDTLAEILFQKQKREQAITLMHRCIALDPEMPYFKRQLKRFQTGNPSSAPPE